MIVHTSCVKVGHRQAPQPTKPSRLNSRGLRDLWNMISPPLPRLADPADHRDGALFVVLFRDRHD